MFRFGDPGGRLYNIIGASAVNLLGWWTGSSSNPAGTFGIITSGGRNGGNALFGNMGSASQYISKTLDAQSTWGVAMAIKCNTFQGANGYPIFNLLDAGTMQVDLRVLSDGTLRVTRGGTTLATSTFALVVNTWFHVEWKTVIHNTTGTTEVRVNGVQVLTASGNTRMTANNSANAVALGEFTNTNVGGGGVGVSFDDIIVYDGQANDPQGNADINDFIGDCNLAWLQPNGDGATTQFARDSGTNNYARVADVTVDADSSYVENLTVGNTDTYTMANLPSGAVSVKSLAVIHYAKKSDTGSRGMKAVIHVGSTDYPFANETILSTSYFYTFSNWGLNPSGPAAWTPTTVNALETGQKVSS